MVPFLSRVVLAGLTVALIAGSALRPREIRRRRYGLPALTAGALVTGDGEQLPLISWLPDRSPAALILGLHGYGDYRRAFDLAGPWLAARGVALYAYDQRGFGETRARGYWAGADTLIDDCADAVRVLRAAHPEIPLVVLGESMGGAVALAGIGGGAVVGVDRLIVAAPAVRGGVPLRQLHDLALRVASLALPWLAVELRRGGRPWLDPQESSRLADDPLILRQLSVGTYDGLIELTNRATAYPGSALPPTLLLYGELDRTIPRVAIDHLAARLGDQGTLRLYPERHHLLLHETDAQAVFTDCLAWLRDDDAASLLGRTLSA
jgi:alpha-beta hydrolase superfamily lysophospholipase